MVSAKATNNRRSRVSRAMLTAVAGAIATASSAAATGEQPRPPGERDKADDVERDFPATTERRGEVASVERENKRDNHRDDECPSLDDVHGGRVIAATLSLRRSRHSSILTLMLQYAPIACTPTAI